MRFLLAAAAILCGLLSGLSSARAHHRAPRPGPPLQLSGALLATASHYIGARNPTGFHGPWCGAFMAMVARRAGRASPKGPRLAANWRTAGHATHPRVGAVMVMRHHVGIVARIEHGRVLLISGNHSHRVGLGWYAVSRAIAFRSV